MHEFKHPKYYTELRKRNKETQQEPQRILDKPGRSVSNSDQAISYEHSTESEGVRPGPGLKPQAASDKLQAPGVKLSNQPVQASSDKRQAPGSKLQASSHKLQAP